jgi:hypothetical protein
MKRMLLVLVLLLLTTTLFAIDGSVGFGWQKKSENGYQHGPFYMQMDLEQELYSSTVYGSFIVEMANKPDTSFPSVSQSLYTIGWSIVLTPFTMSIEKCGAILSSAFREFEYTKIEFSISGHI